MTDPAHHAQRRSPHLPGTIEGRCPRTRQGTADFLMDEANEAGGGFPVIRMETKYEKKSRKNVAKR